MHDTVAKVKKLIREGEPRDHTSPIISERLQSAGLSRALAEPISAHMELLYVGAFHWSQLAGQAVALGEGESPAHILGEMLFSSGHLCVVLGDLVPFLERAENLLGEQEEITFRESSYEREVIPFSRLESTREFGGLLGELEAFTPEAARAGAQAEGDLLKIVYLQNRLAEETPKPGDLYALVAELLLDSRRHLVPTFEKDAPFMKSLKKAAEAASA